MTRLLRIEDCSECVHQHAYGVHDIRCAISGNRRIDDIADDEEPRAPDWCPLPEEGGWVPVENALPEPDTIVEVILVANLEHFDERVPESHWIDVHVRWIATRRWDAPQCGRDPGGWEFVNRVGERWDVRAVVVWRELPPLGREWEERMAEDSRMVGEICGWEREPKEVSDGAA